MKRNVQYLQYPIGILPLLDGSDAKVLLAYLLNTSNYYEMKMHRDDFEVSIDTLSKLMQVSTKTLYKALNQLTYLGVILRTSNGYGNGKQTATYKVNWEKIEEYDRLDGYQKVTMRKQMLEVLGTNKPETHQDPKPKTVVEDYNWEGEAIEVESVEDNGENLPF